MQMRYLIIKNVYYNCMHLARCVEPREMNEQMSSRANGIKREEK